MTRNTERYTITLNAEAKNKLNRIKGKNRSERVRRAIEAYWKGGQDKLPPAYEKVLEELVEAGYGDREDILKRAAYKGLQPLKDELEKELPPKKK